MHLHLKVNFLSYLPYLILYYYKSHRNTQTIRLGLAMCLIPRLSLCFRSALVKPNAAYFPAAETATLK